MTRRKPSKGKSRSDETLVVNGWQLFAHPLFLSQLARLVAAVQHAREKSPKTYGQSADFKLLAALYKLMFEDIPGDPAREKYRQGDTLGTSNRHWFRAKFGGGRFRLFFRYSSTAKIIVYAWVNDENTLRTYGSKTDAYAVFAKMLARGTPPNDWNALLRECRHRPPDILSGLIRTFGGSAKA